MKFSKCIAPFPITYELGQITEIPSGTHPEMIRIEKFHTKTVSILLSLMFEKCRFRVNYPYPSSFGRMQGISKHIPAILQLQRLAYNWDSFQCSGVAKIFLFFFFYSGGNSEKLSCRHHYLNHLTWWSTWIRFWKFTELVSGSSLNWVTQQLGNFSFGSVSMIRNSSLPVA